jgi:hypothetical protein
VSSNVAQIEHDELVELAALDSEFYCRIFFPNTFRNPSGLFHRDMWQLLESRAYRHVALEVFRGGAKTTTLRAYTAKRIAYGVSRTIAYVSEAQDHSKKSVIWLKKQIEHNKLWSETYGLAPGSKWTDEWIEVEHKTLGITISIVALGITGQTRGLNIDDFRPDLIVVDDPCDEENTASPEQRKKISDLFFGALEKSLAPATPNPDAKMVLLQTSLNQGDLINTCHADKQWATRKYGCFDSQGESRWPAVFPTEELRASKQAHIDRNQLLLWLREMECCTVGGEAAYFRADWLQYYDTLPENCVVYLGVDPVPPPSDKAVDKGLAGNDYECIFALAVAPGPFYYVLEYEESRGHTPEWTISKFFYLLDKYRPLKARVEQVAYQRVLKWLLEQEMRKRGRFIQIDETPKRPKAIRINQAYSGIASQRRLFVKRHMHSFISQFCAYPFVNEDGVIDAGAMAIECAQGVGLNMGYGLAGEIAPLPEVAKLDIDYRAGVP